MYILIYFIHDLKVPLLGLLTAIVEDVIPIVTSSYRITYCTSLPLHYSTCYYMLTIPFYQFHYYHSIERELNLQLSQSYTNKS